MHAGPILFIDDNSTLAASYQSALSEHGFSVTTASSGDEAITLCEQGSGASVAIVDLKMPGMDGTEVIAALRERHPSLKIMVVSGQNLQPYFGRLSELGIRHFLPKPFSIEALLYNIQELQAG